MMEEISINIKNVSKFFKLNRANLFSTKSNLDIIKSIDNISMKIERGKMIGIIGKNGSGKTTLLRLIAGILSPNNGSIEVHGRIGPLLQIGTGFKDELNAEENIIMYGMILGFSKKEIKEKIDKIIEFAELEKI